MRRHLKAKIAERIQKENNIKEIPAFEVDTKVMINSISISIGI